MLLPLIGALLSLYGCHDLTAPERLAAPDTSSRALDPAGAVVVSPAEMHGSWFMNDDTGGVQRRDALPAGLRPRRDAARHGQRGAGSGGGRDARAGRVRGHAAGPHLGARLLHISPDGGRGVPGIFLSIPLVELGHSSMRTHQWVRVCDRGSQFGRPAPPARDCRRRVLQRAGSERESWPHHRVLQPDSVRRYHCPRHSGRISDRSRRPTESRDDRCDVACQR